MLPANSFAARLTIGAETGGDRGEPCCVDGAFPSAVAVRSGIVSCVPVASPRGIRGACLKVFQRPASGRGQQAVVIYF